MVDLDPSTAGVVAPRRRRWRRLALFVAVTSSVIVGGIIADGWVAFGQAAKGELRERMEASSQWDGSGFENPQPLYNDVGGSLASFLAGGSDARTPEEPVAVVRPEPSIFETPPASGLRITWLGHSTVLIEIDGVTLLTDPVWGERSGPFTWVGPERWYPPPIPLDDLPPIDLVVLSHDHYDHLDHPTIVAMAEWDTTFIVPIGVAAHLEYWGIAPERIVSLDWWERFGVGTIEVVCTPARHASGRHVFDQNATLWAGYALLGPEHRVFFSGDTGLFDGMREIGRRLGPFDLTLLEVGAYHRTWPDWHLGPEQAVLASRMLRGETMLPVHWGLFDLALHGWTEPIERTLVAARAQGVRVLAPPPGQPVEPESGATLERWWPDVAWETAEQHPVRATAVRRRAP